MKSLVLLIAMLAAAQSFAQTVIYTNDPQYMSCYNFNHTLNGNDNPAGDLACDLAAASRAKRAREQAAARENQRQAEAANQRRQQQVERESHLPQLCVASCIDNKNAVVKNTVAIGEGANLNEAKDNANYNASTKYNCAFVAKVQKCELLKSRIYNNYVEVACLLPNKQPVAQSIVSAKGRNALEAETNARINLSKKFVCKYGVGVVKSL